MLDENKVKFYTNKPLFYGALQYTGGNLEGIKDFCNGTDEEVCGDALKIEVVGRTLSLKVGDFILKDIHCGGYFVVVETIFNKRFRSDKV